MLIVAVDPGKHSGIATASYSPDQSRLTIHSALVIDWENRETIHSVLTHAAQYIDKCGHLVVEDFVGTGFRSTASQMPLRIIGWLECWATVSPASWNLELVGSSCKQRYESTAKLLVGRQRTNMRRHAVDAVAHVMACRWRYYSGGTDVIGVDGTMVRLDYRGNIIS